MCIFSFQQSLTKAKHFCQPSIVSQIFFFQHLTRGCDFVGEIVNTVVFCLTGSKVRSTPIVTWDRANQPSGPKGNKRVVSTRARGRFAPSSEQAARPSLIASRPNRYTADGDSLSAGGSSCVHFTLEFLQQGCPAQPRRD